MLGDRLSYQFCVIVLGLVVGALRGVRLSYQFWVLVRFGGWSFARRPAQLPDLVDSLRFGGWSFASEPGSATISGC